MGRRSQLTPGPAATTCYVVDPTCIDAALFDLDGVLVDTALLYARAWQRLFDEYLDDPQRRTGGIARPFDPSEDYRRYLDGEAPPGSVVAFLASRRISVPLGEASDPPAAETAWGLSNRWGRSLETVMDEQDVRVAARSVAFARALRASGVRTGVVSCGRGGAEVLSRGRIDGLFEVLVDGVDVEHMGLACKPAPGQLLEAARRLGLPADRVAVVESTASGVHAARAGGFGTVIGLACVASGDALRDAGADVVVHDLAEIRVRRADTCCPGGSQGTAQWVLAFDGHEPADEGRRETLCATGNGYMTTRAAAPEVPVAATAGYPGTYLAGVYNRLASRIGVTVFEHEELVRAPTWPGTTFRIEGGPWFGEDGWERLDERRQLDIRHGIFTRELRLRDPEGRVVAVTQQQFSSMADPHLAVLQVTFAPERWSGRIEVRTGIDANVTNAGVVEYRSLAARHLSTERATHLDGGTDLLIARTVQSGVRVAVASRVRLRGSGASRTSTRTERTGNRVDRHVTIDVRAGERTTMEKTVALYTSRDAAIAECGQAAVARVTRAPGVAALVAEHRMAWEALWTRARMWLDVDGRAPLIVNLHVLHLLQSLSPHTTELDAGVTARGLHGEAYRGHVFWDELFVFPFLTYRFPELTRSLLLYRYRRLGAARELATDAGHEGAMFPWQSGTDGRDETPKLLYNVRSKRWMPDHSHLQRHVGLAVGYNVWAYYEVTGDLAFMARYGAELLIEIARFFTSLATYDARRDRYDLCGVMGPDEFHDGPPAAPGSGISDNAYTNVMTAWLLWRAREAFDLVTDHFGGELAARLDVDPEELARWDEVSRKLTVPFDRAGRLAQFDGYEDLEEFDWASYRARYGNIGRLDLILEAEGDTTNRYKLSKQADVLMLFYLLTAEELEAVLDRLGYAFDPATIPETVHYYVERTSHGSTLSRVVNAWVLARSDRERSWALFVDALASDIDDTQGGTTGEGIHLGAMAGTVDLLQRCYGGVEARGGVLRVNPRLPDALPRLRFTLDYRSQRIDVDITHASLTLRARPSTAPPVRVAARGTELALAGGASVTVPLRLEH